jgi:hypothetical protein
MRLLIVRVHASYRRKRASGGKVMSGDSSWQDFVRRITGQRGPSPPEPKRDLPYHVPLPLDVSAPGLPSSGSPRRPPPPPTAETVLSNEDLRAYGYRTFRAESVSSHSDHSPPETPTAAARALIAWFAGALAFESVHAFASGSNAAAAGYLIGAIVVAIIDYKLKSLLTGSPNLTKSLNRLASNARLWVAVAMLSLLIMSLSPFVEQRRWPFSAWFQPSPIVTGFTQQQVDEKIEVALKAERAKHPVPTVIHDPAPLKLGPQKALAIAQAIGNPNFMPANPQWAVFLTYPPENQELYSVLIALMRNRLNPWILGAPDSSTDLDAPKFPAPPNDPGIVFHGDNVLNRQLLMLLNTCFVVRRTDRQIDGLKEWFNSRLSEPERNENRSITWIEIGKGSAWHQGNRLSQDCLQ